MRCEDCPRFDAELAVCNDRKLNPETYADAVEVIQIFGPRAICMLNDHRERMLDVWKGKCLPGKPPRLRHRPKGWF
ncbi:MAG: hypothetical protein M3R13_06015 [Armatimonadota bacterium]|nr:hypothetical protein [Armatimonadota bacterium]